MREEGTVHNLAGLSNEIAMELKTGELEHIFIACVDGSKYLGIRVLGAPYHLIAFH